MKEEMIYFPTTKEWRAWLSENHDKCKNMAVICYKKHTGKPSPSHKEFMHEAICFGWIDTTIKKLDEDRYIRRFARRSKNSKWSYNTLGYAKQLVKEKRMAPPGMAFYKEGLKKKPHDHGIPHTPDMPKELKDELKKNKKMKEKFDNLSNSQKRNYLRWLFRAKMPETKKKRAKQIIKNLKEDKRGW